MKDKLCRLKENRLKYLLPESVEEPVKPPLAAVYRRLMFAAAPHGRGPQAGPEQH